MATDVVLRSVGVQRDFGSVEHHQQLGPVGVEPHEQSIERDEAGFALEDAVEPRPQGSVALFGRGATIRLEITIEGPDQVTHGGLDGAVLLGKGVELVDQTLAMNPAQAVLADIELTGVIADNDAAADTTIGSSIASSTEASSTPLKTRTVRGLENP